MHARVVLGVGLFREVSTVHGCPYRERGSTVYNVCVPLSSSWLAHKEDVVKEEEISIVRLDTLGSQGGCEGVRV